MILVCTKAVDALTLGNENRLKLQEEVLAASTKETEEIINTRLAEKDRELQFLRQRDELNNDALHCNHTLCLIPVGVCFKYGLWYSLL